MESKPAVDYVFDGFKERFEGSDLADLVFVEPSFDEYISYQAVGMEAAKNPEKLSEAYWVAVDIAARKPDGETKAFTSKEDFGQAPGKGRLHQILGEAAIRFLNEHLGEDEKKAT